MSNNNSFLHKIYKYQKLWYKWGCMILCSFFERDPSYRLRIIICMYLHKRTKPHEDEVGEFGNIDPTKLKLKLCKRKHHQGLVRSIIQWAYECIAQATTTIMTMMRITPKITSSKQVCAQTHYINYCSGWEKKTQQLANYFECKISSSVKQRKKNIQWYEQVINLLISPKGNKYYQNLVKSQVSYPQMNQSN